MTDPDRTLANARDTLALGAEQRRWSDTDATLLDLPILKSSIVDHVSILSPIPSSPGFPELVRGEHQEAAGYFEPKASSPASDDTAEQQAGVTSKRRKTYHALHELIESERSYYHRLVVLVHASPRPCADRRIDAEWSSLQVYYRLLHFTQLFDEVQLATITRNAHDLLALHGQLNKDLAPIQAKLDLLATSPDTPDVERCAEEASRVFLSLVSSGADFVFRALLTPSDPARPIRRLHTVLLDACRVARCAPRRRAFARMGGT